jgi:hypothetical protein
MELIAINKKVNNNDFISEAQVIEETPVVSTSKPFIEANTIDVSLDELRYNHIIPVFIKDNEPVISHYEFIQSMCSIVGDIYHGEKILMPAVRVSHPIKGRVPDARNKPANELLEHEKTLYYERMAFVVELPTVTDVIDGNTLSLCVGGVKAYNLDNLYNKKGSDEHFKIFVGFQNRVCTNLCVWSDGAYMDLKVSSLGQLEGCIMTLLENYNASYQIHQLAQLPNYCITEQQFAHLVGKCRMYNHLSTKMKNEIPGLQLGDTQIGVVCKDYYKDNSFCRDENGNINLWRLYNLFTGANKSSYIDNFLDRSVNAYHFIEAIKLALQGKANNWFLN